MKRIISLALTFAMLMGLLLASPVYAATYRTGVYGRFYNGTGTATGAPIALELGNNTVTMTHTGTFIIALPAGYSGTATNDTGTITGSPVALVPGANEIACTGTGDLTVAVAEEYPDLNATVIYGLGTVLEYDLQGNRVSKYREFEIWINTQVDDAITDADIYLAGETSPSYEGCLGIVGTGPRARFSLYIDSTEGPTYPIVVNALVRYNKNGTIKYIQGRAEGILYCDGDVLQVSASFKGKIADQV